MKSRNRTRLVSVVTIMLSGRANVHAGLAVMKISLILSLSVSVGRRLRQLIIVLKCASVTTWKVSRKSHVVCFLFLFDTSVLSHV